MQNQYYKWTQSWRICDEICILGEWVKILTEYSVRALRFGVVYWWSIGSRLDNARTHSNHQNDDDRLEREANRENTADVFKYSFHLSFSVMIICHCIHLSPCFFCWQVEVDKCRSNIKVHESFFEHCQLLDLGTINPQISLRNLYGLCQITILRVCKCHKESWQALNPLLTKENT